MVASRYHSYCRHSDGPTAVTVTATNAACGASNGILTIGVVTAGALIPILWTALHLPPHLFTTTWLWITYVEVTDVNGCVFATTAAINNTNDRLLLLTTNATCGNNNGTLTIGTVTGGVAPYTYSVDGSHLPPRSFTITWLQVLILLK